MYDAFAKQTQAIGRCGEIKEIVDGVMFLSSDQSTFITGHLLSVDGGCSLGGVNFSQK